MFDVLIHWIQSNLLVVASIVITMVLIYHYTIERETGLKLSKRYRNSIFEAQSKVFLNASQYLISGEKDLAIREFLNAVDINRETVDTYFALGNLFRSNGEIEKAISIHRSLIARDKIAETTRLKALKELAIDFDKGGFIDKAIDTYKEVLKLNRDQHEVIQSLCRIYEDIEDWDQAYHYRLMLSKVVHENQSETISHILVQKAKIHFSKGDFSRCQDDLDDAFRYAPSVSAKILRLRLGLVTGALEDCRTLLLELLKEYPQYSSFIFVSLEDAFKASDEEMQDYQKKLTIIRDYFLELKDDDLLNSPSVILSKVRLLKESKRIEEAQDILDRWIQKDKMSNEVLKVEYIKILIELGRNDEVVAHTKILLDSLNRSLARHYCKQCGYNSDEIFWRCPQCHEWETVQFRWKV